MQLKITTDYAVKIVLYLATFNRTVTSSEISEVLGISQSMVFKIGKKLSDAEILGISVGVQGGFWLQKKASEITLKSIIEIFETTIKIDRCLEEDKVLGDKRISYHKVKGIYEKIQYDLEKNLSEISISDLIE